VQIKVRQHVPISFTHPGQQECPQSGDIMTGTSRKHDSHVGMSGDSPSPAPTALKNQYLKMKGSPITISGWKTSSSQDVDTPQANAHSCQKHVSCGTCDRRAILFEKFIRLYPCVVQLQGGGAMGQQQRHCNVLPSCNRVMKRCIAAKQDIPLEQYRAIACVER
jgi:hypothetical protein